MHYECLHSGTTIEIQMSIPISRRVLKGLKECTWKLDDLECFAQYLEEWVLKNLNDDSTGGVQRFSSPFPIDELRKLDFLHTIINGLWRTFWHDSGPPPLCVLYHSYNGSKFNCIKQEISRGWPREMRGLALLSKVSTNSIFKWDQVVEFALFKPKTFLDNVLNPLSVSAIIICAALFFGFHVLVSWSLSKINSVNSSVFFLLLDS